MQSCFVRRTLQFGMSLVAFLALALATAACSTDNKNQQPVPPSNVPDNLRVPDNQVLLLRALGRGVQVYDCKSTPTNPDTYKWVLRQPQANLFDEDGNQIGIHGRGPFWASYDGSRVTGNVLASASPDSTRNVPLLLLTATSNEGDGIFSHVNFIQRLDTKGGVPPTETCAANTKPSIKVDYTAFYYFYGKKP